MRSVVTTKIAKISRCADNAGIPVIILSKRSYGRALMIITVGISKLKLHFNPIQKNSGYQNKKFFINKWKLSFINYLNRDAKRSQNKCMPPNKLQSLYQVIPSTLQFMNGGNLHHQQQFYLIERRISQIISKKHRLNSIISMLFQNHSMTCKDWIWVPNLNSTNCAYSAKQQFKQ